MYQYKATVSRVVDGDTVDFDIDLGFSTWIKDQRVRLIGVDTPEIRTRDLVEKHFGYLANDYVNSKLPVGRQVIINTTLRKKDKYGRILAEIMLGETVEEVKGTVSLNDDLIIRHYAVKYEGQNKDEVEEARLENQRILIESGEVVLPAVLQIVYESSII